MHPDPIYDEDSDEQSLNKPNLRALEGGGESTPGRGNLSSVGGTGSAQPGRVYDDDSSGQPITRPNLRALEGGGETSAPKRGHLNSAGEPGEKSLFNSGEENWAVGQALGESSGGLAGMNFRFSPGDLARRGRIKGLLKTKRGKTGAGIGAALLIGLVGVLLGFSELVEHELVTIEKDLLAYESKEEQHGEKDASKHVFKTMFCKALSRSPVGHASAGCTKQTPEEEATEDAEAKAAGEPLTEAIDSFDITDPSVMASLEGQGIKVNLDSSGNFTGMTDTTTGKAITADDITDDDLLFDRVETALPEWDVGQVEVFRPLITEDSGSSFSGIPEDTDASDADKVIEDKINNGADGSELASAEAEAEDTDPQPAQGTTPTQAQTDAPQETGKLGKAIEATEAAENAGESEDAAVAAGVDAFGVPTDPLFLSTVATDACSVKKAATDASKTRVPTITKLLMRHGTLLISLADELKTGNLNGGVVNKIMSIFNGNPSDSTKANPQAKGSLPFSSSAAWQRITNNPIGKNNPDISASALPTANTGTKIVNQINSIFKKVPGGNLSCNVLSSPLGGVAQGFAGVVQLFSDGFSFGATQIGITTAVIAANETLKHVVLPEIIKYFTPIGINGLEDSVEWMNNADAGTNLAFGNYTRALGGQPLTTSAADSLSTVALKDQNTAEGQESWSDQTFALSNPHSLVSRLALDLPLSRTGMLLSFADYFSSLPSIIAHSFATLFTSDKVFAAGTTVQNPADAYHITAYGLPADKYDPVQNEQYLNTTITYNGKTMKRIDLDGSPYDYPGGGSDPSTTDLYHCFTQNFDGPTGQTTGNNDPICGSVGSYDYDSDAPDPMTDTNVAVSYCAQFDNESPSAAAGDLPCMSYMTTQLNDDIGHFSQYILDSHVANNFVSLLNNQ